MMEPDAGTLRAMGLDTRNHQGAIQKVSLSDYQGRARLQAKLIATDYEEKPPFAVEKYNGKAKRCNFPVTIITCKATVPGTEEGDNPVNIAADSYLFIALQAKWSLKHLTSEQGWAILSVSVSVTDTLASDTKYRYRYR